MRQCILRNGYGVGISWLCIDLHTNGFAEHLQLVDSGEPVNVAGYEEGILFVFVAN